MMMVSAMKIDVTRVPDEGLDLDASYDPVALEMDHKDLQVAGVHLRGRATREQRELFVSAEVAYRLATICARCLEPVQASASKDVFLHYDTTQRLVVDITDDVRQEIMLDLPLTTVCRPDCRGLCIVCGVNLNQGGCPHAA